jgi:hypothetical protein
MTDEEGGVRVETNNYFVVRPTCKMVTNLSEERYSIDKISTMYLFPKYEISVCLVESEVLTGTIMKGT